VAVSSIRFAKYHGTGNDFIMIEDLDDAISLTPELVVALCDRYRGVGGDGVIRVTKGRDAPFGMDLWNADGGRAEMSGNGMRCLARFLRDRGLFDGTELEVDTLAGVKRVEVTLKGGEMTGARVDMGPPALDRRSIPMRGPGQERFVGQPLPDAGPDYRATAVSMGNPHLVLVGGPDLESLDLPRVGPPLEHHPDFPERVNVSFIRVRDGRIDVRTWERGVGETLACGTGACASLVAANLTSLTGRRAAVRFAGGDLDVEWAEDGHVYLAGPAELVFEGEVGADWVAGHGGAAR
jgi:diaminopimelate epimerase